ncbi:MAG TPA: LanC-like protein [Rubrivivax sp.]
MAVLFDPNRHEPLADSPWREDIARSAIARIADASLSAFEPGLGWAMHPLDDPNVPGQRNHSLYYGSGGVVWALEHLARAGAVERRQDFAGFAAAIVERNHADLAGEQHGTASYLLGDTGLLLLQWTLAPDEASADRLFDVVRSNRHNPVCEALWGSPGTVLAAIHMAEATGQPRWAGLVREALQIIWDEMDCDANAGGEWVWRQDLYGRQDVLLGAAHGFVGNVYPALRAATMLEPAQVAAFSERALHTLQATALQEGGAINWPPAVNAPGRPVTKLPLVHDCHGAPGVVCRLAAAPPTAAWDRLLVGAGELSWLAGPLAKGPSLCHGTAGSGMAMLKLWRRTGDELWLRRARALGMHAIEQVERHRAQYGMARHSLWTGDLGVACFLWNCVQGDAAFPTLDVF